MSSLSTGASREVSASLLHRNARLADLGLPEARWRTARNPLGQALLWLFFAIARPLVVWQHRIRDRQYLRHLPDYMLRDIGLDRAEALEEARKPFWRA